MLHDRDDSQKAQKAQKARMPRMPRADQRRRRLPGTPLDLAGKPDVFDVLYVDGRVGPKE